MTLVGRLQNGRQQVCALSSACLQHLEEQDPALFCMTVTLPRAEVSL